MTTITQPVINYQEELARERAPMIPAVYRLAEKVCKKLKITSNEQKVIISKIVKADDSILDLTKQPAWVATIAHKMTRQGHLMGVSDESANADCTYNRLKLIDIVGVTVSPRGSGYGSHEALGSMAYLPLSVKVWPSLAENLYKFGSNRLSFCKIAIYVMAHITGLQKLDDDFIAALEQEPVMQELPFTLRSLITSLDKLELDSDAETTPKTEAAAIAD